MDFNHIPVIYKETINGLNVKADGIYYDATLGGGGHSEGILKSIIKGHLYATDKDKDAIESARERLEGYKGKFTLIHDDFKNVFQHFERLNVEKLDGILVDLGVSSYQLDNAERGFSYINDAPLDMRMNKSQSISAYEVVNNYSEKELSDLIFSYGEDKFSRRIAKSIVEKRKQSPIKSTGELSELIANSYPAKLRYKNGNPSKKTFQAIRIEVNNELTGLKEFIYECVKKLKSGGRMCVITFHSLEDRIVKTAFKYMELDCICDKKMPICVCDKRKEINIINSKPIIADEEELKNNKRAKSAKLRVIEKI